MELKRCNKTFHFRTMVTGAVNWQVSHLPSKSVPATRDGKNIDLDWSSGRLHAHCSFASRTSPKVEEPLFCFAVGSPRSCGARRRFPVFHSQTSQPSDETRAVDQGTTAGVPHVGLLIPSSLRISPHSASLRYPYLSTNHQSRPRPRAALRRSSVNNHSLSATNTAVVRAGTVAVPPVELNVDCLVAGSLEFRCTGCRCKAKPCNRLSVKVIGALVALKITTTCLYVPWFPPLASSFMTISPGVWFCPVFRKVRFCCTSSNVGMWNKSEL